MVEHARIALLDDERFDGHAAPDGYHPERPERLEAARAGVRSGLGTALPLAIAPRLVSEDDVRRVHAAGYLGGLREALSEGHGASTATPTSAPPPARPRSWPPAGWWGWSTR